MTTRRSLVAELKRRNVLRAAALYIGAAAIARQHSSGSVEAVAAVRQACAEGRTADAEALFDPDRNASDYGISTQWQELLLLGRIDDASRLLDRYDTPQRLYALSTYMVYPMFDARRYPLLKETLASQGIEPPLPQPEPYACKPSAASR